MIKNVPRIKIAHLPTAIEPLDRLTSFLNGPQLYVKRDDQTGLAMGGNKTRKLEYLIADAKLKESLTLITAGAIQSNHCRQTAALACHFGFDCVLVLVGEPPAKSSGNYFLDHLFGAKIIWATPENRDQILMETYNQLKVSNSCPYLIPYGGSNEIGATGYAFAIKELFDQGFFPDWIVIPSSSGGTQAGLISGVRIYDFKGKVLGISVAESSQILGEQVFALANRILKFLDIDDRIPYDMVIVNSDYLGGGYGVMGDLEKEAIQLFARKEGLLLDPVYTGRAAGGLLDLIQRGLFSNREKVLFWHTGGTPALFADKYLDQFQLI